MTTKQKHTTPISPTALFRTATLLLMMIVGMQGAWGTTEKICDYRFENGLYPFVNADPARSTLSTINDATLGSNVFKFTCENMNAVALAYYDFSSAISESEQIMKAEFDLRIPDAAGHVLVTLADASKHTLSNGGFTGKSNTGYGNNGSIITLGCWRANQKQTFTINGITKAALSLDTWYHVTIEINIQTKKVSYEFKNTSGVSVLSDSDINYYNSGAEIFSQIDIYSGTNAAGNAIYIDNLIIKRKISNSTFSYFVEANRGKEIASGSGISGATFSYSYPRYVLDGNKLYLKDKQSGNPNYQSSFTLTSDDQVVPINYTATDIDHVLYYEEAEKISGLSISSQTNVINRCSGCSGANGGTAQFFTPPYNGTYKIGMASYASTGTTFYIKQNDENIATHTGSGGWSQTTPIAILDDSPLTVVAAGGNNYALDYVYIQLLLAYKTASKECNAGDSYTPDIMNYSGGTITYKSNNIGVATVNETTGMITCLHKGAAVITATAKDGETIIGTTTHTVIVTSETSAIGTFNYNSTSHTETYTISKTGYIPETGFQDGATAPTKISLAVGNGIETQTVETKSEKSALFCIDTGGYSHVYLDGTAGKYGKPIMGSYYAYTPKETSGILTIHALLNVVNGIRLTDSNGIVLEKISSSKITANQWADHTFATRLEPGNTYYVFAETGAMTGAASARSKAASDVHDTEAFATLYIHSFTFDATQKEETSISISDLLYKSISGGYNSKNNMLDRTIPKFTLTFSGGDGAKMNNPNYMIFRHRSSGTGQLTIEPRLKDGVAEGSIVFTSVTLEYQTPSTTSVTVNNVTTEINNNTSTTHNLTTPSEKLTIKYGSDTDTSGEFQLRNIILSYQVQGESSLADVLDDSKTTTILTFAKDVDYVSNGHPKTIAGYFTVPNSVESTIAYQYGTGFGRDISYASADESIASVSSDGTITMNVSGFGKETTITATLTETKYFLGSTASYTVKNFVELTAGESHTISGTENMEVYVEGYTDDGQTATYTLSNVADDCPATTFIDDDRQTLRTYVNADGDVTLKNTGTQTIYLAAFRAKFRDTSISFRYRAFTDFEEEQSFVYEGLKRPVYWLTLTDNDDEFANGEDLLELYTPSFSSANTSLATVDDDGVLTGGTPDDNNMQDVDITATLTRKAGLAAARGYAPTISATDNVRVISLSYHWTFDNGSAQTALVKTGNIQQNDNDITLRPGNSSIAIPVQAGLSLVFTSKSGGVDRYTGVGTPPTISNATTIQYSPKGDFDIHSTAAGGDVQEYYARSDGYVVISNVSTEPMILEDLIVRAPFIEYKEIKNLRIRKSQATYTAETNYVVLSTKTTDFTPTPVNIPRGDYKLSYTIVSGSEYVNLDPQFRTNGKILSFKETAVAGNEIVIRGTVTPTPTITRPMTGDYIIRLADLFFTRDGTNAIDDLGSINSGGDFVLNYENGNNSSHATENTNNITAPDLKGMGTGVIPTYTAIQLDGDAIPILVQNSNETSGDLLDAFLLTIRGNGKVRVVATYGKMTAHFDITTTGGVGFQASMPAIINPADEGGSATYTNTVTGFATPYYAVAEKSRRITGYTIDSDNGTLSDITGFGCIHVVAWEKNATEANNTWTYVKENNVPYKEYYLTVCRPFVENTEKQNYEQEFLIYDDMNKYCGIGTDKSKQAFYIDPKDGEGHGELPDLPWDKQTIKQQQENGHYTYLTITKSEADRVVRYGANDYRQASGGATTTYQDAKVVGNFWGSDENYYVNYGTEYHKVNGLYAEDTPANISGITLTEHQIESDEIYPRLVEWPQDPIDNWTMYIAEDKSINGYLHKSTEYYNVYDESVHGDNAFILSATEGLQVVANNYAFYAKRKTTNTQGETPSIGIKRGATIILPCLKAGDLIDINWGRQSPNHGQFVYLENLIDMDGNDVTTIGHTTSYREQVDHQGEPMGAHTFRVKETGIPVKISGYDEGFSKISRILVYRDKMDGSSLTRVQGTQGEQLRLYSSLNNEAGTLGPWEDNRWGVGYDIALDQNVPFTTGTYLYNGGDNESTQTETILFDRFLDLNIPIPGAYELYEADKTIENFLFNANTASVISRRTSSASPGIYSLPSISFTGGYGKAYIRVVGYDTNYDDNPSDAHELTSRIYAVTIGKKPQRKSYPFTWDFTKYLKQTSDDIDENSTETAHQLDARYADLFNNKTFQKNDDQKSNVTDRYGYYDYGSYFVDGAQLVLPPADENDEVGYVLPETEGLGRRGLRCSNSRLY